MAISLSPKPIPRRTTGVVGDEELVIPIPAEEAQVLKRKQSLVRRMASKRELYESSDDYCWTLHLD